MLAPGGKAVTEDRGRGRPTEGFDQKGGEAGGAPAIPVCDAESSGLEFF